MPRPLAVRRRAAIPRLARRALLVGAAALGWLGALAAPLGADEPPPAAGPARLAIEWDKNFLTVRGPFPGGALKVHYLEAFCRAGSTDADWVRQTVVPHTTRLVAADPAAGTLELRSELADGVVVEHRLTAGADEVDFRLVAHNPTPRRSEAHWAQPCVRLDAFTGRGKLDYVPLCFVFLEGRLARLPTEPWATEARYTPGQVYCPRHVDRRDVNPRPLSSLVPSSGLCGCFSGDEQWIFATAWEPYQELFQGVATCMHSDFRLGGLLPGETKPIRGKIYLVPARQVDALVARYERDFPEHKAP